MGDYFSNYSTIKMKSSDPVLWMNAAEVAFLRAEGKAIFNFDMGGEAGNSIIKEFDFLSSNGERLELTIIWKMP